MKTVGQGIINKIAQTSQSMIGTVTAIRYDSELRKVVADVTLDVGKTVVVPYSGNLKPGARVVIQGDNFFLLH